MISDEFLEILRCPVHRRRLRVADHELLERLNRAIRLRQIRNQTPRQLNEALEGGLVDETQSLLYPVSNGIPCLLAEEAIELAQLRSTAADEAEETPP